MWLPCSIGLAAVHFVSACVRGAACEEELPLSLLQSKATPVRGHTLPLEYESYRLLLSVKIGTLPAHRLLLDTGSSTVAFCNRSLPEVLPLSQQTPFKACEQYGPSTANDYFKDGYVGPFYQGPLHLEGSTAGNNLQIPDAMYAIFGEGSCSPHLCTDKPSEGIFGVAYRKRNKAYPASANLASSCWNVAGDIEARYEETLFQPGYIL